MFENPIGMKLYDSKINGFSQMFIVTIGDYLDKVSLDNNPFQRKKLSISKYYRKLIKDLLDDTVIPPISVVLTNEIEEIEQDRDKFMIMDGLQRTNCLFYCLDILEKGSKQNNKIKTVEEFRNKKIYLEVWSGLNLNNMLYKMVVLNTGQKKMDYSHQLEILSVSLLKKMVSEGINVRRSTDSENKEAFILSTVVNALVSYINGVPISSKKDAATFLFESINTSYESENEEDALGIVSDEETYEMLFWVIRDLNNLLEEKYGELNPLKKYDVFLIALLASMGNVQRSHPERLKAKKELLINKINSEEDPLNLSIFNSYYNKFRSGIGDKRRKFIYEAFRNFYILPHVESLEWEETYETVFGR